MKKNDTGLTESEFARNLWEYFVIHANQRIQMMNFFIILETFFVTTLLTLFQMEGDLGVFRFVMSAAIVFFSIIFCLLDARTKDMIKYSEKALKQLERKYSVKYGRKIMIFSIEEKKTKRDRRKSWIARKFLSYSKLLNFIFLFFSIIGCSGIFIELFNR